LLLVLIVNPVTNAATIYALSNEYLGHPATAGKSIKFALKILGKLLATNILAGLIIILGFIALIIPGIYLMFRYWFTSHAVAIEEISGSKALKRSGALMKGNINKAFVLGIILFIIGALIGQITTFIPMPVLAIIVGVFLQAVLFAFGAAAGVVFYFSCRCKLENFDLVMLANTVGKDDEAAAAPGAPPSAPDNFSAQ